MSIYYLKDADQLYIYPNETFESFDEAVKKARILTKERPLRKIEIIKSMGIVEYVTITTGEHIEAFFN